MTSPFRDNLRSSGACAVCKVLSASKVPATGHCKRCNRPLCDLHQHGEDYRCMACEAGYEPPDKLPEPSESAGFWLALTAGFGIAAFVMVAMGMSIMLLAGATGGVGLAALGGREFNRARLRGHRKRFLLADAKRRKKLEGLGKSKGARGSI